MKTAATISVALLSALVSAAPRQFNDKAATRATKTVNKAATSTEICGEWDTVETGNYILYQDLWGEDNASSGSQCSEVTALDDNTISWETSWTWAGGSSDVKSYANVVTDLTSTKLSAISSLTTVWDWSYTGSDIVADVSYDAFTASSADGTSEYEIMIWLAALGGAGPISSTGSTVATPTIGDNEFELYSGANGDTTVYSFVATSEITEFSGDLMDFFNYLIDNEGLSSSQYITSIGAGTEPFTGTSAVLKTSAFSLTLA